MILYDCIIGFDGRPAGHDWLRASGVSNFATEWPITPDAQIDPAKCERWGREARERGDAILFIDDSWPGVWPIDIRKANIREVGATVGKLCEAVRLLKQSAGPDIIVGAYAHPPIRHYWIKDERDAARWEIANRVLGEIAEVSDAVMPSLYSFYADGQSWPDYARRNLEQARQYGKPVVPFLWPRIGRAETAPDGCYMDSPLWAAQLDLCNAEGCEGVVIWDNRHATQSERFDPAWPWYTATLNWMKLNG